MSFNDFCKMALITPEAHLAASQDPRDLTPQPEGDQVELGDSAIHGKGVFPTSWFETDQVIGLLLDGQFRRTAIIGRHINHADKPNTRMRLAQGAGVVIVANEPIFSTDEITMDYYDTLMLRRIVQEWGS